MALLDLLHTWFHHVIMNKSLDLIRLPCVQMHKPICEHRHPSPVLAREVTMAFTVIIEGLVHQHSLSEVALRTLLHSIHGTFFRASICRGGGAPALLSVRRQSNIEAAVPAMHATELLMRHPGNQPLIFFSFAREWGMC